MTEPITPMTIAEYGSTQLQLAVIETRPARIPLVRAWKSILMFFFWPVMCFLVKNVKIPPAEAAKIVLTIESEASWAPEPVSAREEPPLNINHPSQRIRVPRTACCGLWAVIVLSSNLNWYFLIHSWTWLMSISLFLNLLITSAYDPFFCCEETEQSPPSLIS